MYAVGRLGSYITRGVSTVSGPFHPFGGAVDIIVVQQQDGSLKSSPWYVRFGKFQGVLKVKERVVDIHVNGVASGFHMYLNPKGEAYFLMEGSDLESKTQDCDFGKCNSLIDSKNGESFSRTLGFALDRKILNDNDLLNEDGNPHIDRKSAEIAADLLESKWSTSFSSRANNENVGKHGKYDGEVTGGKLESGFVLHEEHFVHKPKDGETDCEVVKDVDKVTIGKVNSDGKVEICESYEGSLGNDVSKERLLKAVEGSCKEGSCVRKESVPEKSQDEKSNGQLQEGSLLTKEEPERLVEQRVTSRDLDDRKSRVDDHGLMDPNQRSNSSPCTLDQGMIKGEKERVNFRDIDDKKPQVDHGLMDPSHGSNASTCRLDQGMVKGEKERVNFTDIDDKKLQVDHGLMDPSHGSNASPCTLDQGMVKSEKERVTFRDIDDKKPQVDHGLMGPSHGSNVSPCTLDQGMVKDEKERVTFRDIDDKKPEVNHELMDPSHGSNASPCASHRNTVKGEMKWVKGNIRKFPSDSDILKSYKLMEEQNLPHTKSLPNILSHFDGFDPNVLSLYSRHRLSRWDILRKDALRIIKDSEQLKSKNGDASNIGDDTGKSWSLWPFGKSKSKKLSPKEQQPCKKISDIDNGSEVDGEKDNLPKPKKIQFHKGFTPTPEQLQSLNLTEGKNTVTFKFSTAVLGNQQVDARIFLWRWDTHIVISDVDGTITKSDVLGQFMPLVGKDWSHIGVTNLFSAIKENGYQILFLSARSISQADVTRQFLINLKQDGKTLPEGPVVISPDGLFPSLFREVIRRAPHEFKIACLEDIRVCFPDDRNPFYAGFGNRDTDEFSYLKVGIPKGRIFIINPKGEVVVNRCNETKTYNSIHSIVNGIFPPKSEQGGG